MKQTQQRLAAFAPLAGAAVAPRAAYPDEPVGIMIALPAGGPLDAHARLLAGHLDRVLCQPLTKDRKADTGGTLGTELD